MLKDMPILRLGAKVILVASFALMVVATGSMLADAVDALVSATLFGF